MALDYDQINAVTLDKVIPKMVDNIYNSNPILMRLQRKQDVLDGGLQIRCPLEYAENSASGWYQGAETLDISDSEVFTNALYEWRQHYTNITITRRDELVNRGTQGVINFLKAKIKSAEKTSKKALTTAIYNAGTDSKAPTGLRVICSTSNTVGGISQSTYSWWQAQVSTVTTLTLAAMQGLYGDCGEGDSGEYPDLIACDQDNFDRVWNLIQPQQRFASEKDADAGFRSLLFNSVPIVVDAGSPSGYMFFVNTNYFKMFVHKDENFRFEPFSKPVNANASIAKIYFMGGFGSSNNRRLGAFTSITA